MSKKLSWDEYYLLIAKVISTRSTCFSPAKGAVIVANKSIVSTGYNGAPKGIADCKYDIGFCKKKKEGFASGEGHHVCLALHAEANAIVQAAKNGIKIENATMYCTHKPCFDCAKLIINSGISKIIYEFDYPDNSSVEIMQQVHIIVKRISNVNTDSLRILID